MQTIFATLIGYATDALQSAGNAVLVQIRDKIIAAPATEAKQDAQMTLLAGGLPVALGAGGGVKVDGSGTALPVSVGGTVTVSGAVTVSDGSGPLTVDGTVALAASSAVIGHAIVDSGSITVAGLPALPTGGNTIGKVDQGAGGASAWKVDGSAVTQPVSGSVSVTGSVTITDGSGPLTVDGTVAIGAGAAVIGHVLTDSGSTTAVTALPALTTGANTIGAVTGPSAAPLALDATLTGGAQVAIARGGAKGATTAATVTSTTGGADHQGLDVALVTALPAGSAVIGHVIADSGSTTAVTGSVAVTNANLDAALSTLATQTTLAAVLAKQPATPALESGHLATIDTSTATTATQTTTTATNTGTLAGTVSGSKVLTTETSAAAILAKFTSGRAAAASSLSAALSTEDAAKVPALGQALAASSVPVVLTAIQVAQLAQDATLTNATQRVGALGTDGATIASAANPLPVGPGTSTLWDVSSRVARLIGAVTGKDGATISSASNGVAVAPETSSVWDVKDRVARVLGVLTGKDGSTISGATNGVAVAPETSSVWDVKDRAARLLGALTGINGSSIATGANPVPMQPSDGSAVYTGTKTGQLPTALGATTSAASLSITSATDALFDVKDRAARLLGALTGINGSGVATGANPVPVELSDGAAVYTGVKTAQLPTALGIAVSASALAAGISRPTRVALATVAITGQAISATPCSVLWYNLINNTGSVVYVQIHDTTGTVAGGRVPEWWSSGTVANGANVQSGGVGQATRGFGCNTGAVVCLSTTQLTFTAAAANTAVMQFVCDV